MTKVTYTNMNSTARAILKTVIELVLDRHNHECPDCGYVWEHFASSAGNGPAHCCPQCIFRFGRMVESYQHYTGKKKPSGYWGV